MTLHLQLAIFIWSVMAVNAAQLVLLTWYAWPSLRRHLSCPWCWRALYLQRWFRQSSNICAYHERQMLAQQALRRAARTAQEQMVLAETVELRQEVTV